jgi:phosphoserine phosphatase RsbU/P
MASVLSRYAQLRPAVTQTLQLAAILRHDAPYLFLGAAFVSLGLASAALSFLARRFNAMLLWLGIFAALYGIRLWFQLDTIVLLLPGFPHLGTVRQAINYLVPVPAFFYFDTAGFLGVMGRKLVGPAALFFFVLFALTVVLGPLPAIDRTNSIAVIACLTALAVQSFAHKAGDRDFVLIRWGLCIFIAFALFNNIRDFFGVHPRTEPLGFACFLAILGYVTTRRTLRRDQEFTALQKELDIARSIQTSILPAAWPPSRNFQVVTRYVPMTSIAGDFYDFLVAGEATAGLLIADVSGHGIPAALIASMVKLAASSQKDHIDDPASLLADMNRALCGNTQNQFVTAAYAYLDACAGSLRYAAAAHPPMLLLRAGQVSAIEENGLMLAAFTFAAYTTAQRDFAPGDRLLLYTDGLIEAADAAGTEFGLDRLSLHLAETRTLPPDAAADRIIAAVQAWAQKQSDDLTLILCEYAGT